MNDVGIKCRFSSPDAFSYLENDGHSAADSYEKKSPLNKLMILPRFKRSSVIGFKNKKTIKGHKLDMSFVRCV
jgi:hypothetical protein